MSERSFAFGKVLRGLLLRLVSTFLMRLLRKAEGAGKIVASTSGLVLVTGMQFAPEAIGDIIRQAMEGNPNSGGESPVGPPTGVYVDGIIPSAKSPKARISKLVPDAGGSPAGGTGGPLLGQPCDAMAVDGQRPMMYERHVHGGRRLASRADGCGRSGVAYIRCV